MSLISIMLNPFPIQFLAPLTYVLLRFTIGLFFVRASIRRFKRTPLSPLPLIVGVLQLVIGLMFLLGLYTQYAALVSIAFSVAALIPRGRLLLAPTTSRGTLLFAFSVSLALFITGGGPFGFDLPI